MASTNTSSIGGVEASHGCKSSVVVHERLALAHENNTGNTGVKVVTDMHNLLVDFACRKGASEASGARSAESAAHGTARLRGSTDRELVAAWHTNALNRRAIRVAKQVFTASIFGNLTNNLLSTSKSYLLRQFFSQCFWKIAHLIKRGGTFRPDPLLNLLCAEFWLTK